MFKLGLTGGIASGKSTVLKLFSENSAETIDCDEIVDSLYSLPQVVDRIASVFGSSSKEVISQIVFQNPVKREQLESILHPLVKSELEDSFLKLVSLSCKLVVVDVPLLFEVGWESLFDAVAVVTCSRSQQISRLESRGFSKDFAVKMIDCQMPFDEKLKKADYSLDNSRSIDFTAEQVLKILRDLNE